MCTEPRIGETDLMSWFSFSAIALLYPFLNLNHQPFLHHHQI